MVWTVIPDSDIDPDSPVTTGLMTAIRDNVAAAMNGDAGAPALQQAAVSAGAINRAGLDTATGSASGSIASDASVVITLAAYSFYPSLGGSSDVRVTGGGGTSADVPKFRFWNGGKGSQGYAAYWRYIIA